MKVLRDIAIVGISVVIILGITWGITGNSFFLYKIFAPRYEQARREVFEQSKAYNQGMIQELQNMQFQYIQADEAHKGALASIILHRVADFPVDKLPVDLRTFIQKLRNNQIGETK